MQIIAIKNTIFYKKFCSIRISTPQAFFQNRNALRIINASASVDTWQTADLWLTIYLSCFFYIFKR